MVKVLFDLDNTLYSFDTTGAGDKMRANIDRYVAKFLGTSLEEARTVAGGYYHKYGLTARGMAMHHNVDLHDYCNAVHDLGMAGLLRRDERLIAMLQEMRAEGWDLWILTNAQAPHAYECLEAMGVAEFFQAEGGAWKVIDCFQVWGASGDKLETKPFPFAYTYAATVVGAAEGETVVMVEDSLANLDAPASLGWVPLWVNHGHELPEGKPFVSIKAVYETPAAIRAAIAQRQ